MAKSCIMTGSGIVIGTGSCIKPSFDMTLYVTYGGIWEYPKVNISPVWWKAYLRELASANNKEIFWRCKKYNRNACVRTCVSLRPHSTSRTCQSTSFHWYHLVFISTYYFNIPFCFTHVFHYGNDFSYFIVTTEEFCAGR